MTSRPVARHRLGGRRRDRVRLLQSIVPFALPLGAAAWLAVSGRWVPAALLVAAIALLLAVLSRSTSAADRVHRVAACVTRLVGRAIGTAFLAPLHLLVLAPIGMAGRVVDRSPFGPGRLRSAPPRWQARAISGRSAESAAHPFANREGVVLGSRRPVTLTVVAVLAIQALALGGVLIWRERHHPQATFGGASDPGATDSPALAGLGWVPDAARETGEASSGMVYTPFTGWSIRDYAGTYVNVRNRVRRSYQPKVEAGTEPLDVWFFGGSTMFGYDLQRDLHTIPSEVARLAEADGIPVRVRNYGTLGYVNYQESVLFSLLVTAGQLPDLVVFYDGTNDLSLQLLNATGGLNASGEPADIFTTAQRRALAATDLIPGLTAARPTPLVPRAPRSSEDRLSTSSIADDTIEVYRQGMDLTSALAARHGIAAVFTWQPDAFSKRSLDPGETQRLTDMGFDERSIAGMRRLSAETRSRLPAGVVDLSAALDGVAGPVLSDTVHVNEAGGHAVAQALYEAVRPLLADLRTR